MKLFLSLLLLGGLFLTSCIGRFAQTPSGRVYSQSEVMKPQQVRFAKILSVREVILSVDENKSNVGAVIGAVSGGVLSSNQSNTKKVGSALLGAVIGKGVTRVVGKQKGREFTLRMEDSSETLVVVQKKDKKASFKTGERVRVIMTQNGRWRVAK